MAFNVLASPNQESQPVRELPKFTSTELQNVLMLEGYRYCVPRASTWHSALIYKHCDSVLCLMFRKNGVDLRYYESYSGQISIDINNVASFTGGDIYRNCYDRAFKTHRKILPIARKFARGKLKRSDLPGVSKSATVGSDNPADKAPSQPGAPANNDFL